MINYTTLQIEVGGIRFAAVLFDIGLPGAANGIQGLSPLKLSQNVIKH